MSKTFNHTLFTTLVMKALDGRTQKQFAEESGISPFNLNRLLNSDERVPQRGTLAKIAEASRGKVTMTQLEAACGYITENEEPRYTHCMTREQCEELATALRNEIIKKKGTAMKYDTPGAFLKDITMRLGMKNASVQVSMEQEYTGIGRNYAENYVHCRISWLFHDFDEQFTLALILYYCVTKHGGYIISDCAFDMDTLMSEHNPDAFTLLKEKAKLGDVSYADYDLVTLTKPYDSPEARLLHAIFGEGNNEAGEDGDHDKETTEE